MWPCGLSRGRWGNVPPHEGTSWPLSPQRRGCALWGSSAPQRPTQGAPAYHRSGEQVAKHGTSSRWEGRDSWLAAVVGHPHGHGARPRCPHEGAGRVRQAHVGRDAPPHRVRQSHVGRDAPPHGGFRVRASCLGSVIGERCLDAPPRSAHCSRTCRSHLAARLFRPGRWCRAASWGARGEAPGLERTLKG
jgi:hypothetical protein